MLRVVEHNVWWGDRQTLLKVYITLIQSRLRYWKIIHHAAWKSYLNIFKPTFHEGLKLKLGLFKIYTLQGLYVQTNKPSTNIITGKLAIRYYIKLETGISREAYNIIFDPKFWNLFLSIEKAIQLFGFRMDNIVQQVKITLFRIHNTILKIYIVHWTTGIPQIALKLCEHHKKCTSTYIRGRIRKNI